MTEPLRYYSTNHDVPPVTLDAALLQGQAADRGLFMPESFPAFSAAELATLRGKPYPEVAFALLNPARRPPR